MGVNNEHTKKELLRYIKNNKNVLTINVENDFTSINPSKSVENTLKRLEKEKIK